MRARVDGEVFDIDAVPELAPRKNHDIEAVVDRIVVREGARAAIAESIAFGGASMAMASVLVAYLEPPTGDAKSNGQRLARSSCSARSMPAPTAS